MVAFGPAVQRRVYMERAVYGAAALGLGVVPSLDLTLATGAAHTFVFGAAAIGTWSAWKKASCLDSRLLRSVMRVLPFWGAAAVDAAALYLPGWGWDAALAGLWAAGMGLVAPLTRSGRPLRQAAVVVQAEEAEPEPAPDDAGDQEQDEPMYADDADEFVRSIRAMWHRSSISRDLRLYKVVRHGEDSIDFTALIKAPDGQAVPRLHDRDLAAAFGVEPHEIALRETAGGPGWAELLVTPDAAAAAKKAPPSDEERWAREVAGDKGGVPGSVYTGKAVRPGVTHYFAKMADPTEPVKWHLKKLCHAFGAKPDDMRVFVTDHGNELLVSVFDEPPLSVTTLATRELISPDSRGFFRVGTSYDGRPVNGRLYHEGGAAHALLLGASGSGKTQLVIVYMAADSLSGATVWGAAATEDAKLRLAGHHVDRLGFGPLYMVRLLRAGVKLLQIRGRMGERVGHDWIPGAPDNIYKALSLYLDEFNSASKDEKYGDEITELAEMLSVQGRKYGIGIKVSGQDGKVEDGQTTTMRNQLRQNGRQITLNVGDMDAVRRAFNGLIASDFLPEPLPQEHGGSQLTLQQIAEGMEDPEDSQGIGGLGWIVRKGRPVLMRTLYVDLSGDDREQVLAGLFPDTISGLTDEEVRELGDLLGDWNEPEPEPDEDEDDEGRGGRRRGTKRRSTRTSNTPAPARPRKKKTAATSVQMFLSVMPSADLDLVLEGLALDGFTKDEITAAYNNLVTT